MQRLSSAFVALLILALSATAVFASRGALVADRTVPVQVDKQDASESPEASETPEATETPEASESPEASREAADIATSSAHPDNHGAVVSAAAQASTPPGWKNHGEYVSSIARQNHGHQGGHGGH